MVLFYALVRVARNRAYARTLPERLGFLPPSIRGSGRGAVWIHAVSVGEVIAAETLLRSLRKTLGARCFVSTTTLAGYEAAKNRLEGLVGGYFYAPIDYVWTVRRALRQIEPSVLVVLETEIWPNLFREAKRAGCGLVIANGRISDRAFPKYRRWRPLFRRVLRWPDAILAQSETMRDRYVAAGAPGDRVRVAGNVKFDFEPRQPEPGSPVVQWLKASEGPVLIAASTTADGRVDEDRCVLESFAQLPGWRLILAPRKPERFEIVANLLRGERWWRRTAGQFNGDERVLLLDTIGELPSLFPLADVVFMGGTLTETGGHNFLEPAFAGKPVVMGPRLENFREMADDFRAHRAFLPVDRAEDLTSVFAKALLDQGTGLRARERAEAQRGAVETTTEQIGQLYEEALFSCARSLPTRTLVRPLAWLWETGARWRLARELKKQRRLNTPVISVGNITMGGTGKTPFVLYLAKRFRERGLEPVVLSRGYGRSSHRDRLVLARRQEAAVWHTGDEPQILLRSGECGLGIGSDRCLVGEEAEKTLRPDVFLLDDGFSHLRLARDVDIVLIDALNPFGGGEVVPLGRLREPVDGLARADIFVITRCDTYRPMRAIENELRRRNGRAPIFRSKIVTIEWVSMETGQKVTPPERVLAFCGLGNAKSFWRSLEKMGIQPMDCVSYGDHHSYSPRDLQSLVAHARNARAEALLCTEKDLVNFPQDAAAIFGDLPVLWLRVEVEMENEDALFEAILGRIARYVHLKSISFGAGRSS